jgi:hypothetical protein
VQREREEGQAGCSIQVPWIVLKTCQLEDGNFESKDMESYRDVKNQRDWGALAAGYWDDGNQVGEYSDPSVHRRRGDTWLRLHAIAALACILAVRKSSRLLREGPCGKPEGISIACRASAFTLCQKYLIEGMGLDLGELVFHVIRIHRPDLLPGRGSQDLDDLDQLVDARFAWE